MTFIAETTRAPRRPHRHPGVLLPLLVTAMLIAPGAARRAHAQGPWQQIGRDNFTAVRGEGTTVMIVGQRGKVVISRDGGEHWLQGSVGTQAGLLGLDLLDERHAVAVGLRGTIVTTSDAGVTWRAVPLPDTLTGLRRVRWVSADTAFICGDSGTILRSVDGLKSWSRGSTGTDSALLAMAFVTPSTGWSVGVGGTILRTTDAGETWAPVASGTTSALKGVDFLDARHGLAVGVGGTILRTSDAGATWQPSLLADSLRYDLEDVRMLDDARAVAIGKYAIFRSSDGGISWSASRLDTFARQFTGQFVTFLALSHRDADHGIITGSPGVIISTDNGWTTWREHAFCPTRGTYLTDITFVTREIAYATGERSGMVMKSTDGGNTWRPTAPIHDQLGQVYGACFTSPDSGFVVGTAGIRERTTDGGASWVTMPQPTGASNFLDLAQLDRDHDAIVGDSLIWITTDGGATWSRHAYHLPSTTVLARVCFADPRTGFVTGNITGGGTQGDLKGFMLGTTDGGDTWNRLTDQPVRLYGMHFRDRLHGFVVGDSGTILRTTDGGGSWTRMRTPAITATLNAINFLDDRTGYAVGEGLTILVTGDGGATWSSEEPYPPTSSDKRVSLSTVSFPDSTTVFIAGSEYFFRRELSGRSSVAVEPVAAPARRASPRVTALPNPAGGHVLVTIDGIARGGGEPMRCGLYDMGGREVIPLTGRLPAAPEGAVRIDIPVGKLPSGVYVVRLVTDAGTSSCTITVLR